MDGIIIINKEKGCTSHDVVYKVKKMFKVKVGHTGTLDPNATGVLPILLGKGTELSQFLVNHDKKYIATIKLGVKTDTADAEGNIIEKHNVDINMLQEENVKSILKSIIGKQKQIPPMYSAIKVNGKKLYEYARKGQNVEVKEREIEVYNTQLINIDTEHTTIKFEVHCSKGTYIRTLCEKIAESMNTVGYMQDLERTMVGEFLIENSITVGELEQHLEDQEYLNKNIITIEKYFEDVPDIKLNNKQLNQFLNGVFINNNLKDGIIKVYDDDNKFIGIGINENNQLKRKIVL